MPMLDIAVTVNGLLYKSQPFCDCLDQLDWKTGEGLMNAITLFTAMCNNKVYCPIISRERQNRLKMVWEDNERSLIVWIHPALDIIRYATCENGKTAKIITVDHYEALALIEYWASFLNQK